MRRQVAVAVLLGAGFVALPAAVAQVSGAINLGADFSCGDTTPTLSLTPGDFKKGFAKKYDFPGTERCELGVGGRRGGSISLTYCDQIATLVPDDPRLAPLVPGDRRTEGCKLMANVYYWEEVDCRENEDDPPRIAKGWFSWDGELEPTDTDPEGLFPAASYGRGSAKLKKLAYPGCIDSTSGADDRLLIRLVLVRKDEATNTIDRTPHLVMSGDFFGGAIVFGPVAKDGERALVSIEGCADIGSEGAALLVAKAEPPDGEFTWSADPASIFNLDGTGSEIFAVPTTPGRATIRVDYDPPGGERVSATRSGSVVNLRSVNNGTPLEVGVYDFEGKAGGAPARSFPTLQEPPDSSLLRFEPDDPALVTVVNEGDGVMVQGQGRVGTTTAQARTQCRESTGPVFTINVVPCDEETQAKVDHYNHQLTKSEKEILDGLRQATQKAQSLRNDPAYTEALASIKYNALNTATSIGEALLLGRGFAGKLSHAGHIVESGLTGYNVSRSAGKAIDNNDTIQAALAWMGTKPGLNVLAALAEEGIYFDKFVKDASQIGHTEEQVAELIKQTDFDVKRLYELYQKHKRFCERNADGSKPPPSRPPTQRHDDSSTPSASDRGSGPSGGGAEPGGPGDGTGGDAGDPGETISPPPPDTPTKPTTGGFIIADCGCGSFQTSNWGTDSSGLRAIGTDFRKAEACGTNFGNSLESIQKNVTNLNTLPERLAGIAQLPDIEAAPLLQDVVKEINDGVMALEAFEHEATAAKASLESCGDQPRQAGDIVNRSSLEFEADITEVIAEGDRITVESLRTHY